MKRFAKIYVEISNQCNLKCRFCAGTRRKSGKMDEQAFAALLPKLRPFTDFLYFHLMGEPLCHPQLERFLELAGNAGFRVILTTNGTLLNRHKQMLLAAPALHKVNISLHAFEANDLSVPFSAYLRGCTDFAKAAQGKILTVLRLWNQGGEDTKNAQILAHLRQAFPQDWEQTRNGQRLSDKVYLQWGEKFDWPDLSAPDYGGSGFCYGLRDQLGILCDGTVVPCCLDHDGDIPLGNIFSRELQEILDSPRAKAIYDGFSARQMVEPLCRRCGYARRFSQN